MKTTNESGRSMVEMLGVLAIIGVLSIGGIAGYSMAMNRYRANEALDVANKYAVILYAGYQTAQATGGTFSAPDLEGAGLTTSGKKTQTPGGATITHGSTSNNDLKDGVVELKIEFTSGGVCKAAASILGISAASSTSSVAETPYSCKSSSSCTDSGGSITYCFRQS